MPSLSNIQHSSVPSETPTQPIVSSDASEPTVAVTSATNRVTVIDHRTAVVINSRGRSIKVKKLSALDRMRLFKACGAEDSENRLFMSYASAAAAVTELEGAAVAFPSNQIQLSATVAKLDEDGLEAVVTALIELNPEQGDVATAAKNL